MADMLRAAKIELQQCKLDPNGPTLPCRQAMEKIWGHVHGTARRTMKFHGQGAPLAVRKVIIDMEESSGTMLRGRYSQLEAMHGDCFYENLPCSERAVAGQLEQASAFLEDFTRIWRNYSTSPRGRELTGSGIGIPPVRLYATYKPTGKRVEILAFAPDLAYITDEPGDYTRGKFVPYEYFDPCPNPDDAPLGWTPWWDRDDTVGPSEEESVPH